MGHDRTDFTLNGDLPAVCSSYTKDDRSVPPKKTNQPIYIFLQFTFSTIYI